VLTVTDVILILDGTGHGVPGTGDAYERDQAFQERIRAEYLSLAASDPERYVVIDAMGTAAEVHARVWDALAARGLV
jgi:thymidylate kinase